MTCGCTSCSSLYLLPEIKLIGGATEDFEFNLFSERSTGSEPYSADGCSADFSIVNHSNKLGKPLITKSMSFVENSDGIKNIVTLRLEPHDTKNFFGKYIYQITIKDPTGEIEPPMQGILLIQNNINKTFIV